MSENIPIKDKKQNYNHLDTFKKFFIKAQKENDEREKIRTEELAKIIGVPYDSFRKIVHEQRQTTHRDLIIVICIVLFMDEDNNSDNIEYSIEDKINEGLRLYGFPILDTSNNERDDVIIDGYYSIFKENNNIKREYSIVEKLNDYIVNEGMEQLTFYKSKKEKKGKIKGIIDKRLVANKEWSEFYDTSIKEKYNIDHYNIREELIFTKNNKKHLIAYEYPKKYYIYDKEDFIYSSYDVEEDALKIKEYFESIELEVHKERKRIYNILNDTKNYQKRIGANCNIDGLRIFAEKYNYNSPEKQEYYLIIKINNSYKFFKNNKSYYLNLLNSKNMNLPFSENNGSVDLNENNNDNKNYWEEVERVRDNKEFENLKKEVDELHSDLINRKQFLLDYDTIYQDDDSYCIYYNVEEQFECIDYPPCIANKQQYVFEEGTENEVIITLEDLKKSFELGIENIEEVCKIKRKYTNIANILK